VAAGREEITDEALMLRYQGGDRSAFATLLGRHETPVFNFILRHVRSRELAEDLTQDVFVRVVQSASEFRHSARFTTWMYAIARNLCIDQLRKLALRRHPSLDQPTGNDADGPSLLDQTEDKKPAGRVDRSAIGNQLGAQLVAAIEQLPEEQREVFLLREVARVPFKDIATMIGIPENTVKSRMRYALERLQRALDEYADYAKELG
jgi:RNA polymerase sigma-70 factor (ECF subfamily)